jgi:3-dehydroquinate synthase
MGSIRQEVQLAFRYSVHFTNAVFDPPNPVLRDVIADGTDHLPSKIVAVVDDGVHVCHGGLLKQIDNYCAHHEQVLRLAAPPLIVPGGEQVKSDSRHVEEILGVINDAGLCRHSYVIAVGGGAVLDVAGYAAATAHRGIRLIRVPTTVLAQDDSGVGVKNGINAFGKKNYVGTFAPPFAVINDFSFLTTLSDRDWRSGISEAVKVALIRDAAFFGFLERNASSLANRDMTAMRQMIRRCAELHLLHIAKSGDPFELGSSRPLDFGHWAAHKLEQLTDYDLRHGEGVAIGIALDSTYSYLAGFLPERDWQRIMELLPAVGLPVYAPELGSQNLLHGLSEFREHLGGKLTITLLRSVGEPFDIHEIDGTIMVRSIELLKERSTVDELSAQLPLKG